LADATFRRTHAEMTRIFRHCFHFLEELARDNPPVQKHLFDYIDVFLKTPVAIPEMASCVSDVRSRAETVAARAGTQCRCHRPPV